MQWNFQYRLEIWFSFDTESVYKIIGHLYASLRTYYWLKFWYFEHLLISLWHFFHWVSQGSSSEWGYIKPKIPGWLNKRIQWFLSSRHQQVVVDGATSDKVPVISGIPQDTVLGPLLFLRLTSLCWIRDKTIWLYRLQKCEDHQRLPRTLEWPLQAYRLRTEVGCVIPPWQV